MARLSPGDVVNGHYGDRDWYLATVEQDNQDGTFTIAWFDGDPENRVKRADELVLMHFNKELEQYEEVAEAHHGEGDPPQQGADQDEEAEEGKTRGPADEPEHGARQDPAQGSTAERSALAPVDEDAPAAPEPAPVVIPSFVKGMRVEIVDPTPGSKINGEVGNLVSEIQPGRWKVDIYDSLNNRKGCWVIRYDLLKEASKPMDFRTEPPETPYLIVGSWNEWDSADPMIWDSERHCLKCAVQVGVTGQEEFQFLLDGDWKRCIHPDMKNAGSHGCHWKLCGPDDQGHHKNWVISGDGIKNIVGAVYEVRLFLLEDESVTAVEWVQTEPPDAAARAKS